MKRALAHAILVLIALVPAVEPASADNCGELQAKILDTVQGTSLDKREGGLVWFNNPATHDFVLFCGDEASFEFGVRKAPAPAAFIDVVVGAGSIAFGVGATELGAALARCEEQAAGMAGEQALVNDAGLEFKCYSYRDPGETVIEIAVPFSPD